MKPPLPPELVRLGDELERDVREQVVHRPRRRQLALGILSSFVITVPMAFSLTAAELSRPVSQLSQPTTPAAAGPDAVPLGRRPGDEFLPRSLRRAIAARTSPLIDPSEPTPLRPALR